MGIVQAAFPVLGMMVFAIALAIVGAGGWTRMKGYTDALEWVLKEE